MVYTDSTLERPIEEGRLLFLSQVKIAFKQSGRDVGRLTILKMIERGKLKAKKSPRGTKGERFEWMVDPKDLKETMRKMHQKRPPGGSWFKD